MTSGARAATCGVEEAEAAAEAAAATPTEPLALTLTGEALVGWGVEVYVGGDDGAPLYSNAELEGRLYVHQDLPCNPPCAGVADQNTLVARRVVCRRHH